MSVFRIEKNKNYTVMSNYHLKDKNLSLKAKGLLSFMLSLPDDWDYSMNGLVAVNKENISAIRTALHELEENNYLKRIRQQKENGKFVYEYIIYEEPPHIDFLHTVNPYTENHTQINTNIQNTNNKDKYDKQKFPLIKELINRNFIDKDDLDIPKYYDLLNELLEEYEYYDVVKVCGYIADKWKDNNGFDENGLPIENKYGYFKTSLINNLEKINNYVELDYEDLSI